MFRLVRRCVFTKLQSRLIITEKKIVRHMCTQLIGKYASLVTNPDIEKQICQILEECEEWKKKSRKIPSAVAAEDMQELLTLNFWQRKEYIKRLWKLEIALKEEEKRQKNLLFKTDIDRTSHLDPVLIEQSLELYYTQKLCTAALFGQPLVFDLSYDDEMDLEEVIVAVKNINMIHSDNKTHTNPFDLFLCNVNYDSDTGQILRHLMTHLCHPISVLQIEKKSYMDLFPKEKLVYLSPNAQETVTKYDHDAIYVIGALVEIGSERKPTSLMKAEQVGLRTAKLPLVDYSSFKNTEHCLRMREVINILLNVKETGDWESAISEAIKNTH